MDALRVIGNNCKMQFIANKIDKVTFAQKLGYDLFDVEKLCDGRLFVTDEDLSDIANEFRITVDELCENQGYNTYVDHGCIHCMGRFANEEDQDAILDIFDMYCNLREVLNK